MPDQTHEKATNRLTVLKDKISRLDDDKKLIDQHKSVTVT
jgi:hypothetical protein